MRARYAGQTTVTPMRSRAEIEHTLQRYGADQFAYAYEDGKALLGFRIEGRAVKLEITMPTDADDGIATTTSGRGRKPKAIAKALQQAERQRWHALALMIKAKLEAVALGVTTLEQEFLAGMVMPNGLTIGQVLLPKLQDAVLKGKMPKLLEFSEPE